LQKVTEYLKHIWLTLTGAQSGRGNRNLWTGTWEQNLQILKYWINLILRLCRIPVSFFHEIWHADIMVMKTLDGIKSYLYFLMDNYSRLIKYKYLFKQDFRDIHDLRKGLEWIVFDYNNNRPHISLRGLTPNEAATGENVPKDMWHEQIIQAQKLRLAENRKELCRICK
jgi:hypothetical protein